MGIIQVVPTQAGLVGTIPTFVYINTNDTYATFADYPSAVGNNSLSWLEAVSANTAVYFRVASDSNLSGMIGTVLC